MPGCFEEFEQSVARDRRGGGISERMKVEHLLAIMAASRTTVTRAGWSLMTANGVTEPGSTPRVSRINSAEPNEKRPDAPSRRCSDLSSIAASSGATIRNNAPFLSRRKRFLVWPPASAPRRARASSNVNTGG
jgi:hypothetical protein